jgi:ATP synthase F1 epsilon subunit
MILNLLSPEKKIYEGLSIKDISLQSLLGRIQILPGHLALSAELGIGPFFITLENDELIKGSLSLGYVDVSKDVVDVYAELVEFLQDIDWERAKNAQKKAIHALSSSELDDAAYQKYRNKLVRSFSRLSLFE